MKKHFFLFFLLLVITVTARGQSGQSTIIVNSTINTDTSLVAKEAVILTDGFSFTAASGKSFSAGIDPDLDIPVYISGEELIDPQDRELDKSLSVGTLPGSLDVNSLGAAVYNIPLFVSPGTAGLQPSVSIEYNSMSGDGLLGRGWDLAGISTIQRVPRDFYHDDERSFIALGPSDRFALDSNRLVLASGTYGSDGSVYKTELETFSRITAHGSAGSGPSWFEVETKDGRTIQYGNSSSSRVEAPGSSTALMWRINRIADNYGNYIVFTYFEQSGESYIEKIEYTGNSETSLAPYNSLKFEYTERADSNYTYVAGSKIQSRALLTSVRMETEGGALVRRYQFRYNLDFCTHLVDITLYGSDNKYNNSTAISWGETKTPLSSSDSFSNNRRNEFYRGDYNGDGRTDFVMTEKKTSFSSGDKWELWLADSYGTSFTKKNEGYLGSTFKGFIVSDSDGDGKSDLYLKKHELVSYDCNPHPCNEQMKVVSDSSEVLTELADTTLVTEPDSTLQIGDIDNLIFNPPPPQDTCYDVCYHNNIEFLYYYYSEQTGIVRGSTSKDLVYEDCPADLTLNPADLDGNGQSDYIILDQYKQVYSVEGVNYLGNYPFLYDFRIIDFNGDGIDDILSVGGSSSTVIQYDWMTEDFDTLYSSSSFPDGDDRLFTGDFNGDKKTDLLVWNSDWSLKFSTGTGFESSSALPQITDTDPLGSESDNNVYISDLNGDNKDDILEIYLSGSSSVLRRFFSMGAGVFVTESGSFAKSSINQDYSHFGDFNGDGRQDLFFYDHSQASSSVNISFFGRDENKHMIRTISNGLDQKSTAYFSRINSGGDFYQKGTGAEFPVVDYNGALYVVDSVAVVNYLELTGNLTNYTYNGLRLHKQGKGVIGFSCITSGDTANGRGIVKEYSYHPSYFFSYPSRITTRGRGGGKVSQSENTYSVKVYSGNRFFPYLSAVETTDSLSGGFVRASGFVYDDYGNVTADSTIYYNGAEREEATFSTREYYSYGNWGPANKMISTQVTSQYGSEPVFTRSSEFTYNNLGSLLTEESDPGTSLPLTKTYSGFSDFGLPQTIVVSASASADRTTELEYDSKGRFVTRTEKDLSWAVNRQYDPGTGNILSRTDPDALITTYQYDGFGRLIKQSLPSGVQISTSYNWDLNADGGETSLYYVFAESSAPGRPWEKVYYDMAGRKLHARRSTFDEETLKMTWTYNSNGSLFSETLPYKEGETVKYRSHSYDDYGREISSHIDSLYSYTEYDGNEIISTNAAGKTHRRVVNSAGRLESIEDESGNDIQYDYFSSGNLKSISSVGTTLEFEYDTCGNRTSYSDPNSGTTTYEYNAFSELISQTDASDNTFSLSYDLLGRLTQKEGPEGNVCYTYIDSGNGFGKIDSISAPDSARTKYVYDALGRTASVTERTGNKQFTTSYTYNLHGDITGIKYPSGAEIEYIYDEAGTCTEIKLGTNSIWTLQSVNSAGQPLSVRLKNSIDTIRYIYDDYGYLTGKETLLGTQGYTWRFSSGNLTGRSYSAQGISENESFSYDAGSRLSSFSGTGSVSYDSNGNISSKTDAGEYTYDNIKVNAVTGIDTLDFTAIARMGQQITYTASGMVKTIAQGGDSAVFRYNPGNQRIMMQLYDSAGLVLTKYYSGSYEKEVRGTAVRELHYISSPFGLVGVLIKQNSTSKFWYAETDHLGSITGLYDSDGTANSIRFSYDAWGRRRNPVDWSYSNVSDTFLIDRGFTGHEHLDVFGLINMNGRVYDPVLGRFLSPDPIVQDVENSQSFNAYTYCLNSPLIYIDPSGFNKEAPFWFKIRNFLRSVFGGDGSNNNEDITRNYHLLAINSDGHTTELIQIPFPYGGGSVFLPVNIHNLQNVDIVAYRSSSLNQSFFYYPPRISSISSYGRFFSDQVGKPSFNIDKAVSYLNEHAYPKYDKTTCGYCARAVRLALEAGGINTSNHPFSAKDYGTYLLNWGFNNVDIAGYLQLKGDIRVFQNYPGGSIHGHINMYNGDQWVSDFLESGFWPGRGFRENNATYSIYRWGD